ncbi:MAG: M10 family metallopeptidase [Pseudomonadota bacterium]
MSDVSWTAETDTVVMSCACAACSSGKAKNEHWGDYTFAYDETGTSQSQSALGTSFSKSSISGDGISLGDKILSGYKWATTELTYSFPNSTSDYGYNDHAGQFSALNGAQRAAAKAAFDQMEAVSGLTFTEITGANDRNADLRLAEGGEPSTAWAYYPSSGEWGGDMWYNPTHFNSPTIGSYAFSTFLHEAGHAVGLKHGHDTSFAGALTGSYNSHEYSLMTYHSSVGGNGYYTNSHGHGPQTFMMADIQAIQIMYGANYGTNAGNTVYTFSTSTGEMFVDGVGQGASTSNVVFRTLWDGNGTDTYDLSNYSTNLSIDLAPGGHSDFDSAGNAQRARLASDSYAKAHLFNALMFQDDTRSLIENAKGGSGNDLLRGNAADNVLWGNGGDDTFHASAGNDTFHGGAGSDRVSFTGSRSDYSFGVSGSDLLVQSANGTARVMADADAVFFVGEGALYSIAAMIAQIADGKVSSFGDTDTDQPDTDQPDTDTNDDTGSSDDTGVTLTGTAGEDDLRGSEADDLIRGYGEDDRLSGNGGDDTIKGGEGKDRLLGGDGNDNLFGGNDRDNILGELGDDRLYGGAEKDKIYGGDGVDSIFGGEDKDQLFGGSRGDMLYGGADNDNLMGQGGGDSLFGGDGKDRLTGGSGNDHISGGAGRDSMRAGTGNDTLLGEGGEDRLDGQEGNDSIDGGAGDDRIIGGDGKDRLAGGADDDMLTGGNGADVFVFASGDGTDLVRDFALNEDRLDVSGLGVTALSDFAIETAGKNVTLSHDDVSIELRRISESDLSDGLFLFA